MVAKRGRSALCFFFLFLKSYGVVLFGTHRACSKLRLWRTKTQMAETTGIHLQAMKNPYPTLAKQQTYRLRAHTRLVLITSVHSRRECNNKVDDVKQLGYRIHPQLKGPGSCRALSVKGEERASTLKCANQKVKESPPPTPTPPRSMRLQAQCLVSPTGQGCE